MNRSAQIGERKSPKYTHTHARGNDINPTAWRLRLIKGDSLRSSSKARGGLDSVNFFLLTSQALLDGRDLKKVCNYRWFDFNSPRRRIIHKF